MTEHRKLQVIAFFIFFAILGCGKIEEAAQQSSSGGTTNPTNPPVGEVQNDKMWVRVFDEGRYSHYLHKVTPTALKPPFGTFTNNFGTACEIAATTTPGTATDVMCLLQLQEGDMYVHGLKLQANVPPNMCTYFRRMPPFFYNFEPGYVEATVTVTLSDGTPTGCTVSGAPLGGGAGAYTTTYTAPSTLCTVNQNAVPIFTVDLTNSAVTLLRYDFRPDGPNCAIGKVNVVKVATDTAPTPDAVTTTRSEFKFGEKLSDLVACIKGPAVDGGNWTAKAKNGWPVPYVSYVNSSGANERMDVNPIIQTNNASRYSIHIANMFDYGFALRAQAHAQTNTATYLPRIFHPYRDRGLNHLDLLLPNVYDTASALSGYATSQYTYEFQCLDAAWEMKARIRLLVADWNTNEAFQSYATSQTANPDITGSETGGTAPNCKYIPGIGYACNDWEDTDDSLAAAFAYPNELSK